MRGGRPRPDPVLIPPLGITTRQSTDTLALRDAVLSRAMSFIHENAARPIRVNDVAAHVGVSRRLLEMKFSAALHRPPAEEIRRTRLERAKELLHRTDMAIPAVAEAAGFGSPEYLSHVFRTALGCTPLRYRRDARSR